jgi:hypothetical protein
VDAKTPPVCARRRLRTALRLLTAAFAPQWRSGFSQLDRVPLCRFHIDRSGELEGEGGRVVYRPRRA